MGKKDAAYTEEEEDVFDPFLASVEILADILLESRERASFFKDASMAGRGS